MTDIVSKAVRSKMMAGIRSKDTKPELRVRRLLHREGLRFGLKARVPGNPGQKLPGRPDLTFPKYKAVVFVHGCYWHRHQGCSYAATPSTNADFWQAKFRANVERDARVSESLRDLGWRVFVVWACSISDGAMARLAQKIRTDVDG